MSICEKCIHRIVCDHESGIRSQCMFFDEKRPHGEWLDVNGDGSVWKCSNCGETIGNYYCGNCGADMRKKSPCDNCIDDSDCDRCDVPLERR